MLVEIGVTAEEVWAERDRRLALGFEYDFGDRRGAHHIGTSDSDMKAWMQEVNPMAQMLINIGRDLQPFQIFTNTGSVEITPAEWQNILLYAVQYRQPIWQGSEALAAMGTIPGDYASNDAYWNGGL